MTNLLGASQLTSSAIRSAHSASEGLVRRTPILSLASVAERFGGDIAVKAENLQRTGSFKLRGALNKVRILRMTTAGVVAGSAGNHAQALAYAARAHGIACEVWMPHGASTSKVNAVRAFGARVHYHGETVDECVAAAAEAAGLRDLDLVHPFDDLDVIAGQAGLGLELLEDVEDLAQVVVPVGGGGLASGIAAIVKRHRPDVRVIGVQAARCASFARVISGQPPEVKARGRTIADGIAIKRPGELTMPLLSQLLDDLVVVGEEHIAEAIVMLLERGKLLTEGAGAVTTAAVLSGAISPPSSGTTVLVLSGGNIDTGLLASIASRHE